jgi:glutamyl-tRNA synthetase
VSSDPSVPVRVRFAPSPTGVLHIGGARTALYNWLLARGRGGKLVLRIEDTDRERSTPENTEQILDTLRWLELDWDEGPVSQYERSDRHRERLAELLDSGRAYRDAATADDVAAWKKEHGNRGYRGGPSDDPAGAVRLRVPDEGDTVVDDEIRGEVRFPNQSADDFVIARGDGSVLYNFAVAVDDVDMEITDVVRGDDHLSNTPKQLLVMEALGVERPRYAHLPLLHGPDGKKLSKRHGAASVQELRDKGYLPEAVRNYLALLGWGFDDETTFFSTEELKRNFSLEGVSKSPAVFDEQKLRWMNGRYVRELGVDDLTARLEAFTGHTRLRDAVEVTQEKISTLDEFWPLARSFFEAPVDDPAARERFLLPQAGAEALGAARTALADVPAPWSPASVEPALRGAVESSGMKAKQVFQPLRVALTGSTISPGIFETVALVGRDRALERIDAALDLRRDG